MSDTIPRGSTVLAITSWAYDDALVQTYTLPYLRMVIERLGSSGRVVLVTQEPRGSRWRGTRPRRAEPGLVVVPHRYAGFGPRGALHALTLMLRVVGLAVCYRAACVHVFGTPAGVQGVVVARLLRRRLVLDSFEPHAEAMVENGTWAREGRAFRVLWRFEARMARQAWACVATTAAMREYALDRFGACPERFHVKPACVDLERFHPPVAATTEERVLCIYAGKLGGIYLDVEVFEMLHAAREHWGERFHAVLLTDAPRPMVEARCVGAGLDPAVVESRQVPHDAVADELRAADFALNPVRPVPTKRYCTSIKDGEYWATGLPVLIPAGISDDSDEIAARRIGVVLDDLTPAAYRRAVEAMDELLVDPERAAARSRARAAAESLRGYDRARAVYAELYG